MHALAVELLIYFVHPVILQGSGEFLKTATARVISGNTVQPGTCFARVFFTHAAAKFERLFVAFYAMYL